MTLLPDLAEIFYSFVYPVVGILINIMAIYAASLLLKRTRTRAPWLLLCASSGAVLCNLAFPVLRHFSERLPALPEAELIGYLGISCASILLTAAQFFAILLIAHEVRAAFDLRQALASEP